MRKILLVFAGPNGSGKSTITSLIPIEGEYVNADNIQRQLNCSPLEAAQIAEDTREYLLSQEKNFTIETVLSTERNIILMKRARQQGYIVLCVYILTADPHINIERVKNRIAKGGNVVSLEKVIPRYCKALRLLPELFQICHELHIYDNSLDRTSGEPSRILSYTNGIVDLFPSEIWTLEMLKELTAGRYAERFESTE